MKKAGFAAAVTIVLLSGVSAMAQEAAQPPARDQADARAAEVPETVGVADIVVTAQKREQRLQDVPVAVSAVTGDTLTGNRIQTVRDLDAIALNLTVRAVAGGSGLPAYTIRGVLSIGSVLGADKGVALYVNGVYIGASTGAIFELADIERIEVLRGPQGTLFGRNATGGAISITSPVPDGKLRARQTLTLGNYDQLRTVTSLSTPQFGPLSANFSYIHSERRGDIRNLGAGTRWNFTPAFGGREVIRTSPRYMGNENLESFAATVKLQASTNLEFVYRFDYSQNDYTTTGQGVLYAQPIIRSIIAAQPNQAIMTPVGLKRPKAVNGGGVTPNTSKGYGHALTTTFDVTDNLTIKNITAYRNVHVNSLFQDIAGFGGVINTGGPIFNALLRPAGVSAATIGAPVIFLLSSTVYRDKQFSSETQVNLDLDAVTLTAGALYYKEKVARGLGGREEGIGGLRAGSFLVFPGYAVPYAGQPQGTGGRLTTIDIKSLAAYAQAEVHATDQIDLVAGARITRDQKTGIDRTLVSGVNQTTFNIDYEKSRLTYILGVNYKPTSDILLYAKYSTGFISGTSLSAIDVEPEVAKSWEAGIKADWFNRVLRTNLALFNVKYSNLQLTAAGVQLTPPRTDIVQALINAGDARARGFELETTLAPARGLTFSGALGYTDFKYLKLLPVLFTGVGGFFELQRPAYTANLSGQYDTPPLFANAFLSARIDANWKSRSYQASTIPAVSPTFSAAEQDAFRRAITVEPYWLVNARLSLQDIPIGRATGEIALWGRNILDNKSLSYGASFVTHVGGDFERARTYGVDFTVRL